MNSSNLYGAIFMSYDKDKELDRLILGYEWELARKKFLQKKREGKTNALCL